LLLLQDFTGHLAAVGSLDFQRHWLKRLLAKNVRIGNHHGVA
jgi:hypothetical protein